MATRGDVLGGGATVRFRAKVDFVFRIAEMLYVTLSKVLSVTLSKCLL